MKNTKTMTTAQAKQIEVRSATNDNVVLAFEHTQEDSVNVITAGYNKICAAFGIDRMNAERRYYVTQA